MPTQRETILQALLAALQTVPGASVLRGAILPERIPPSGLLILRDGDPGTPEVTLSPLQYHYEHRAEVEVEIEVIVQGKTPTGRPRCCFRRAAGRTGNRNHGRPRHVPHLIAAWRDDYNYHRPHSILAGPTHLLRYASSCTITIECQFCIEIQISP